MKKSNFIKIIRSKRAILILCMSLFVGIAYTNGQNLKISTYIEKTHLSPKFGTEIGLQLPGIIGPITVGGFYQKSSISAESEKNNLEEFQFYGAFIQLPFLNRKRYNVNFEVRSGYINNNSFVIAPLLNTEFYLTENIGISLGCGMRSFMLTGVGKLVFRING